MWRFLLKVAFATVALCLVVQVYRHYRARALTKATHQAAVSGYAPAPGKRSTTAPPTTFTPNLEQMSESLTDILWIEQRTVRGARQVPIAIDSSVERVLFAAMGTTTKAHVVLAGPTGQTISSGTVPSIQAVEMPTGAWLTFEAPTAGTWTLRVEADDSLYLTVRATTQLGIDNVQFVRPEPTDVKRLVEYQGALLAGGSELVAVELSGTPRSFEFFFVGQDSTVVMPLGPPMKVENTEPVPGRRTGRRYLFRAAIPNTPFRLFVRGRTDEGHAFQRMSQTLYEPEAVRGLEVVTFRSAPTLTAQDCQRFQVLAPLLTPRQNQPARLSLLCLQEEKAGSTARYLRANLFYRSSQDRIHDVAVNFINLPIHSYSAEECDELLGLMKRIPDQAAGKFAESRWSIRCEEGRVYWDTTIHPKVR